MTLVANSAHPNIGNVASIDAWLPTASQSGQLTYHYDNLNRLTREVWSGNITGRPKNYYNCIAKATVMQLSVCPCNSAHWAHVVLKRKMEV